MTNDVCVFSLTQIADEFSCEYGRLVTRRNGPDIACQSSEHQGRCGLFFEKLKQSGLTAFDYEDDLTQVPHGIWAKIQYGGLLGLQKLILEEENITQIDNISDVITKVLLQFGDLSEVPFDEAVQEMRDYKIRKRRK